MNKNETKEKKGLRGIANNNGTYKTEKKRQTKKLVVSTSTSLYKKKEKFDDQKKGCYYTINLDWFEFVCTTMNYNSTILGSLHKVTYPNIKIIKKETFIVKGFRSEYCVYYNNCEICEMFSNPSDRKYNTNEILIKVSNAQLYTSDWSVRIKSVLDILKFTLSRIQKIDIALDGGDLLKKISLLKKCRERKTVELYRPIRITDDGKPKADRVTTYYIGDRDGQKSATIYDKTSEIENSNKHYIKLFWERNGLNTKQIVVRFELSLGYKFIKRYGFSTFEDFCDVKNLGSILYKEVEGNGRGWLKFCSVKLKDLKRYQKNYAKAKGKKLMFIHWEKLPQRIQPIQEVVIDKDKKFNAKRSLTFAIDEMLNPKHSTNTSAVFDFIVTITKSYNLQQHTISKFRAVLDNGGKYQFKLNELDQYFETDTTNI